jgi:hypothetical protein
VGNVRIINTSKGYLLKYQSEELRNDALPQIRTYIRQNMSNVKAVASITAYQAENKGLIYETLKDI